MRILLVSHYFPPEVHGGTQSYLEALADHLAGAGHEISVLAGSARFVGGGSRSIETRPEYSVVRLHRDREAEFYSGDMGCERLRQAIITEIKAFAPDLVHVHHWHGLVRGLIADIRLLRIPTVLSLHDLFASCPRHFRMPDARQFCAADVSTADCARCIAKDIPELPLPVLEAGIDSRKLYYRADLKVADRVLTVSAAQRTFLRSIPGFEDQEMEVMPIGTPRLAAVPPPEFEVGQLRIVNWAGLDPRKGPQILMQAVAATKAPKSFRLRFHGRLPGDSFTAELKQQSVGLNVEFLGEFDAADRPSFAAENDVAVMPYLAFETYALTVDEALHLGMPVVVSDHGAPRERIGGKGRSVPADDVKALAALLDELRLSPTAIPKMQRATSGARFLDQHFEDLKQIYLATATRSRG